MAQSFTVGESIASAIHDVTCVNWSFRLPLSDDVLCERSFVIGVDEERTGGKNKSCPNNLVAPSACWPFEPRNTPLYTPMGNTD